MTNAQIPTTGLAPVVCPVWGMKYRYSGDGATGAARDANIQAAWCRVARALAAPEADAVKKDVERQHGETLAGSTVIETARRRPAIRAVPLNAGRVA